MENRPSKKFLEEINKFLNYNSETGVITWKVSKSGNKGAGSIAGSVRRGERPYLMLMGKNYASHRIAWLLAYSKWPESVIDHIDGNPLNNRLDNLRDVCNKTNSENQRRPHSSNKSGFLGVVLCKKTGKFIAQIKINGVSKHLGVFLTAEFAHNAYLVAKRQFHAGNRL